MPDSTNDTDEEDEETVRHMIDGTLLDSDDAEELTDYQELDDHFIVVVPKYTLIDPKTEKIPVLATDNKKGLTSFWGSDFSSKDDNISVRSTSTKKPSVSETSTTVPNISDNSFDELDKIYTDWQLKQLEKRPSHVFPKVLKIIFFLKANNISVNNSWKAIVRVLPQLTEKLQVSSDLYLKLMTPFTKWNSWV